MRQLVVEITGSVHNLAMKDTDHIFFPRDPILFPSFIHTQKRNPVTHLKVHLLLLFVQFLLLLFLLLLLRVLLLLFFFLLFLLLLLLLFTTTPTSGPRRVLGLHILDANDDPPSLLPLL